MARKKKLSPSPVDPISNSISPVETDHPLIPTETVSVHSPSTSLAIPEGFEPRSPNDSEEIPEAETQEAALQPRGPFWFQSSLLSQEPDGPKMRLGRDNRFQQMAIQFEAKPTEEVRQRLHQDGWRWRPAESIWTKQLEFDRKAQGHLEAERLFDELAKIEMQERKVEVKQYQRG
jgi:hypothetical protein